MHFLSCRPFCLYCSWWLWMSGSVCVLLHFLYTLYLFIQNFQAELVHFFQNIQTSNSPYILFILLSIFMTFSKTASFVSNWSAFPNTEGNSFTKYFVRCVLSSFPHRILETQAPYIFGALILNYMTSKFIYKWKQRKENHSQEIFLSQEVWCILCTYILFDTAQSYGPVKL